MLVIALHVMGLPMFRAPVCSPAPYGHMQCDLLNTAVWWRDSGVKLPARVQNVQSAPGVIKQKNCSVLPYVLG